MPEIFQKIRPTIVELEVGASAAFSIKRINSVRVMASMLGISLDRVFSTHINRENKTIEVTRVS